MAALGKRKRVSKNNKKSWRKNVDITDVENFLEDVRLEERLGQQLDQKPDDEIFAIDTTGVEVNDVEKALTKERPTRSLRLKETTTPKCYALLEKRSAVPDPLVKRNGVNVKKKEKKVQPGPFIKRKGPANKLSQIRFRSIWAEEDKSHEFNGLANWMTPETVRNVLRHTGQKKITRPRQTKKPSPLSAVEVAHPGMSYNPSLADHQELLQSVAATEAATEKKEQHIYRVTTKMFRKVPREEAEKAWMTEMSAGLNDDPDSSPEMGDYSTVNPPVERKKKTLKERRKAREARERLRELEAKKMEKKKRSDVNERLAQLKNNLAKKEKLSLEYQSRKKEREDSKIGETKVLGPTKFEAPLLEFQSPGDLRGSLRQLEPTGSVLSDRFYSLQKRNIVEPTLKRNIRKAKVKRFIKPSHKMGFEPKGY